jgi:uncharacterized protein YfaS (alpha-2-macroglobulin family)
MGLPAITGIAGSLFSKLEGLTRAKASQPATAAATSLSTSNQDAVSVSGPGLLFTQLQNLSQQNPAEFKKISAQVAQQLQAASSTSSTSAASLPGSVLAQMSSNFQNASKTGKFTDLFSHSAHGSNQPGSTSTNAGQPHQQYAEASGATVASTVSSIFSQALNQIKTDLGSTAALNLSS